MNSDELSEELRGMQEKAHRIGGSMRNVSKARARVATKKTHCPACGAAKGRPCNNSADPMDTHLLRATGVTEQEIMDELDVMAEEK